MAHKENNIESKLSTDGKTAIESSKAQPKSSRDRVRGVLKNPHVITKSGKALLDTLKILFEPHPERYKKIDWAGVEKVIAAHPLKPVKKSTK